MPVLCASLVWGIAFVLYSVILGHMGSDAVAANSIASIVKSMVQCVIRGVSAGAGIIIGNLLGAGKLYKGIWWKNYKTVNSDWDNNRSASYSYSSGCIACSPYVRYSEGVSWLYADSPRH